MEYYELVKTLAIDRCLLPSEETLVVRAMDTLATNKDWPRMRDLWDIASQPAGQESRSWIIRLHAHMRDRGYLFELTDWMESGFTS